MKILEELWYGNVSPGERSVEKGSRIQKQMQKQCALESKLTESLTEEQRLNFEQYLSLAADILDANCLDSFITGFRLGAQFTHEAFIETDAPFANLTMDKN